VSSWILCGSDHDRWDHTLAIADETGGVAILGVHPWAAAEMDAAALAPYLQDLARRPLVGVGEIGLDVIHAPDDAARENQRRAFRAQLAVARDRDLPVAIHCVRAYPELLALLERDGLPRAGGMMHAWSGHPDQVGRALALGLYVSFGPMVMFDRAKKARGSVALVPDERLLVETDCPNMRPPGEDRGEPAHLPRVVAELARLRNADPARIGAVTRRNLLQLVPALRR
jgi:TatD DNase family protein